MPELAERIRQHQHTLNTFSESDMPEYEQWMQKQFRPLINELNRIRAAVDTQNDHIEAIEDMAFDRNISYHMAWSERFGNYVQRDWFEEEANGIGEDLIEEGWEPSEDSEEFERVRDELDEAFRELLDPGDSMEDELLSMEERDKQVKKVYRDLARRLHPDRNPDAGEQEENWWHQTQKAYQDRNLSRLEVIFTLIQLSGDESVDAEAEEQRLERVLEQLEAEVEKHQSHPAWGFSQNKDQQVLARRFEKEKRREIVRLKRELNSQLRKLKQWSRPPLRRSEFEALQEQKRFMAGQVKPTDLKSKDQSWGNFVNWVQLEFDQLRREFLGRTHASVG